VELLEENFSEVIWDAIHDNRGAYQGDPYRGGRGRILRGEYNPATMEHASYYNPI